MGVACQKAMEKAANKALRRSVESEAVGGEVGAWLTRQIAVQGALAAAEPGESGGTSVVKEETRTDSICPVVPAVAAGGHAGGTTIIINAQ